MSISPKTLLTNWAVLIALWAPVYVSLLEHFRLDAAHSDTLKWALVAIGACGMAAMLVTCWQASRPRKRRVVWQAGESASLPGIERATVMRK